MKIQENLHNRPI